MKQYVQYGCGPGPWPPKEWINFDVSPTLLIQKMPILGVLIKNKLHVQFADHVQYGNIINGLPIPNNSCDGLYCSHTLEHLTLEDFRIALANSYKILKPGGIFRCLVPDLEYAAKKYLQNLSEGNTNASIEFVGVDTLLGIEQRPKGLKGKLMRLFGNSHHLWMWDKVSMMTELKNAGFTNVRTCTFNDCEDKMFQLVENEGRFLNAVTIECSKS